MSQHILGWLQHFVTTWTMLCKPSVCNSLMQYTIRGSWGSRTSGDLARLGSLLASGCIWQGTRVQWTCDEPYQTLVSWLLRTSAGQPWCLHHKKSTDPYHNSPTPPLVPADSAQLPDMRHAGHCAKPTNSCSWALRTMSSCSGPAWHPCPCPSSPQCHMPRPQPRLSSSGHQFPNNPDLQWWARSPERNTSYQTGENVLDQDGPSQRRTSPARLRSLWSANGKSACQSQLGMNLKWKRKSTHSWINIHSRKAEINFHFEFSSFGCHQSLVCINKWMKINICAQQSRGKLNSSCFSCAKYNFTLNFTSHFF